MSAPVVWILFPAAAAAGLYALRRWPRAIALAGLIITLLLAWLAWKVPIGEPITLGPWPALPTPQLDPVLSVLGRRFVVDNSLRPVVALIYAGMAFWFGGTWLARPDRLFYPLGLAIAALLTASLAVEPFLYAALLIEMAALCCVPILSPPGQPVGRGALRFLTLVSLGMPFILFAGWLLNGVETDPSSTVLVLRTALTIGLGFGFLMAIFPFHTWIPMLAEEAEPYPAAFVFLVLPGIVSMFGLGFLQRYPWLAGAQPVTQALQWLGVLMLLLGGGMAAFQTHAGRVMGYATLAETGLTLLAFSLASGPLSLPGQPLGAESDLRPLLTGILFAQIVPRALSLGVWALALSVLQKRLGGGKEALRYRSLRGLGYQLPVAASALALAQLSLAGVPLLAAFPVRMALWSALAGQSLVIAGLALLGSGGLLVACMRSLGALFAQPEASRWSFSENRLQASLLGLGGAALVILGIFPQWLLPFLLSIGRIFGSPAP